MKKTLAAIAAVALVAAASLTTSTDANAQWRRGWGWGPGAFVAGVVGGAVIGSMIARSYGPQYVVEPGWEPYPVYRVRGPVGCPGGYWARRPLVDPYGNVVGWSKPRFFCPEGY